MYNKPEYTNATNYIVFISDGHKLFILSLTLTKFPTKNSN